MFPSPSKSPWIVWLESPVSKLYMVEEVCRISKTNPLFTTKPCLGHEGQSEVGSGIIYRHRNTLKCVEYKTGIEVGTTGESYALNATSEIFHRR
jgi:hypothetical protein